ncbi:hypothetical protein PYW08_005459 [Mythimna loreyi]|uniref:Uncharacterized protein n=1 Tax=Mythimna loreyi TaxID=667449 RepID=A0ACC2QGR7_9NEOP|nr:hypothetical protein PYW08_005459 [Mythimna loreyi]
MVKKAFDAVHWYMSEVESRLVAKTGIPSDRHHLGKLILHSLREDPDFLLQIDGATHESETNGSALDRSIRCAVSLTNLGLKQGDVMVLMAPNHIDYCIPHNAAMFLGIMVASIDATLGVYELQQFFQTSRPKIIFHQSEKAVEIKKALALSEVDVKVVTFNEGSNYPTLAELLKDADNDAVKNFEKNFSKFPTPTRIGFLLSPAQWVTAGFNYLFSPILKYTRLQTSAPVTPEHFADLVTKYQPTYVLCNPVLMATLAEHAKCDFSCFEHMTLAGCYVSQELVDKLKKLTKTEEIYASYGMSELSGPAFVHDFQPAPGSLGRPLGSLECRIVDPATNKDVTEPNIPGELWFRGPNVFIGYHNNPAVTKEALTEDGWFKCGDVFYRDHSWNVFFVERLKSLLKYRNHQVSPLEIETVIMRHPGVLQVAVTGIPDKECGDLVVACVVPSPGYNPTAQEIKDLVKESLTDTKQLRGGVIFMEQLPTTSASKIDRGKLKQLVLTLPRE